VDKSSGEVWAGAVVPKRHARRAVTRNLLKRQIRSAFARYESGLPGGLWLVRLRRPLPAVEFASAASDRLRDVTRAELALLFSMKGAPSVPGARAARPSLSLHPSRQPRRRCG
jgi:ribonuclease P protein component